MIHITCGIEVIFLLAHVQSDWYQLGLVMTRDKSFSMISSHGKLLSLFNSQNKRPLVHTVQ
jgi:hypothetical protein